MYCFEASNILVYLFELLICIYFVESTKPFGKRQREIWRLECDLGVITDLDCPINGGWSSWSPWSKCQGACDNVGHRRRIRECTNPPTSNDGTPCSGSDEQIEACYIMNCSVEDFHKIVEGDVSRIEALRQLEVVPALLERCLPTECSYEAVEAALSSDNTWQLNPEVMWNSLQCVKHNMGCPIIGDWGSWGSWSACGARCGKGLRWRQRRCDSPPPSDATLICTGSPLQSEGCAGDQCAIDARYEKYTAKGTWSIWGSWSSCSEVCGSGVRRRKRTCLESNVTFNTFMWGTHCQGQHDQLEVCINNRCSLDGGWSGWGPWSPCSQSCGAGKRLRTRSCTKPIPSGDGRKCDGQRVETGSCYLEPCEVYTHTVAILNGESFLRYDLSGKKSTLFHFYIRFMPLSPSGTLVRRGSLQSPYVRLSLQKWHICLDACGMSQSCGLSHICSSMALESTVWHTVLIAVSSEGATIRLDNMLMSIKRSFPCDPALENSAINVYIGERFHGEIQELILNFHQLKILSKGDNIERREDYFPSLSSNLAYEKSNLNEAILILENGHYIRVPCFDDQNEWRMELTIKPNRGTGLIFFLRDTSKEIFFYVALENMRIKMKVAVGLFRSESSGSNDYLPNQWLDITLSKKQSTNTIESTINAGERIHISLTDKNDVRRRAVIMKARKRRHRDKFSESISLCKDEFFIGNIPSTIKSQILEEIAPFHGFIASLSINGVLIDLYNCSLERCKDNNIQLSSRTASISRTYLEITWGISNSLNLTCLHTRFRQNHDHAHWLFLDTSVNEALSENNVRVIDDGTILELIATQDINLRGFYTCRTHSNKYTYNVITYGVLGHLQYSLNSPDLTTIVAVFTTVTLIVCTLVWLFVEGINDLRQGYGFFRDANFSPEEEADAVCKYIDQNAHLYTSKSAVKQAKTRARRRGRQLASRMSFGAQEPQGLLQMHTRVPEVCNESESSELETLPALPEIKSSHIEKSFNHIYSCEPSYQRSPQHGSIIPTEPKLNSSYEMSPRTLCSRLFLTKYKPGIIDNFREDKASDCDSSSYNKNKSKIIAPTVENLTPAQKVLQKFNRLRSNET